MDDGGWGGKGFVDGGTLFEGFDDVAAAGKTSVGATSGNGLDDGASVDKDFVGSSSTFMVNVEHAVSPFFRLVVLLGMRRSLTAFVVLPGLRKAALVVVWLFFPVDCYFFRWTIFSFGVVLQQWSFWLVEYILARL